MLAPGKRWMSRVVDASSQQAHRQRKLHVVIPALVPLDELFKMERHVMELQIAAPAQFVSHLCRAVPRPTCRGVEAHDANRVAILSLEHAHDDRLEVGPFDVGFAKGAALAAEIIQHKVHVLVVVVGTIEGVELELGITGTPAPQNLSFKRGCSAWFLRGSFCSLSILLLTEMQSDE